MQATRFMAPASPVIASKLAPTGQRPDNQVQIQKGAWETS